MKSALFYLVLFFGFGVMQACTASDPDKNLPNIVFILTDDQGWGDVASHGNPDINTPALDALAASGARFNRFFVSPVCAPTRASLLTGRDHLRTGTQWVTYGLENMRPEEVTFGEVFQDAGYTTGLFGKWHNGSHYPMDPIGQGFEEFFGFTVGHWNNYFDTELQYGREMVETEGYITDVLTDSTLSFIERNSEDNFFAFVSYNTPHSPFQVPDSYFDKYKSQGLSDKNASVYGMVENIDDNVGRIVTKLEELNLTENTIVIFMTDNGPNGGDRYNGNMKGWKAKVDEGGVRVPLFISWPGTIKPGTYIDELAAHIDFLPSLVDLAGIEFEPVNPIDGRSFKNLIFEENPVWDDRLLYTHQSRWDSLEQFPASVRNNRYRLVKYADEWELYNLKLDPSQRSDISEDHPAIVDELSNSYQNWFSVVTEGLPMKRPIPVGYNEAPIVNLPAVESSFSGSIEFYGDSGWSNDWITNWTSVRDSVWWELEVVDAGEYTVSVEYTLKEENRGVEISAYTSHQSLSKSIDKAFDPDFLPSPDRVERGEVYEKPWAKVELGSTQLEEGNQTLTIKSTKIPGAAAIDLYRINLEKKF
jgi:arylsulfatase A